MQLITIEQEIKKNCLMLKIQGENPLLTDPHAELSKDTGFIIFIAIARSVGYTPSEITEYLSIGRNHYNVLLDLYNKAFRTYSKSPLSELYQDIDIQKKVIAKISLISNALGIGKKRKERMPGFPDAEF